MATDLFPTDWDWIHDSLICDVTIENRCKDGKVSYRAREAGKLLFDRQDFDFQTLILTLKAKGHIP